MIWATVEYWSLWATDIKDSQILTESQMRNQFHFLSFAFTCFVVLLEQVFWRVKNALSGWELMHIFSRKLTGMDPERNHVCRTPERKGYKLLLLANGTWTLERFLPSIKASIIFWEFPLIPMTGSVSLHAGNEVEEHSIRSDLQRQKFYTEESLKIYRSTDPNQPFCFISRKQSTPRPIYLHQTFSGQSAVTLWWCDRGIDWSVGPDFKEIEEKEYWPTHWIVFSLTMVPWAGDGRIMEVSAGELKRRQAIYLSKWGSSAYGRDVERENRRPGPSVWGLGQLKWTWFPTFCKASRAEIPFRSGNRWEGPVGSSFENGIVKETLFYYYMPSDQRGFPRRRLERSTPLWWLCWKAEWHESCWGPTILYFFNLKNDPVNNEQTLPKRKTPKK